MTVTSSEVIRISLLGVVVILVTLFLCGLLGGVMAFYLLGPRSAIINEKSGGVPTTVQQITVSPSTLAAEIVQRTQRSALVIVSATSGAPLATGVVVTNDGLVLTSADLPPGGLVAIDEQGTSHSLETIGTDLLFGVTYFKINDGIFPALDIRQENSPVGSTFLVLSRSAATAHPVAFLYHLNEMRLPREQDAAGIQQLMRGTPIDADSAKGSPLLDEEGRMAGLMLNPSTGLALPAQHIHDSLDRAVGQQREKDPLATIGFSVRYTFQSLTPRAPLGFVAEVTAIVPGSRADQAGLLPQDKITSLNDQPITWEQTLLHLFSQEKQVFSLTVFRKGQTLTIPFETTP